MSVLIQCECPKINNNKRSLQGKCRIQLLEYDERRGHRDAYSLMS